MSPVWGCGGSGGSFATLPLVQINAPRPHAETPSTLLPQKLPKKEGVGEAGLPGAGVRLPRGREQRASTRRSRLPLAAAASNISLSSPAACPRRSRSGEIELRTSGCFAWQALPRQAEAAWLLPEEAGAAEDARGGPQPRGCGVARRQVKVTGTALRSTAGPGTAAAVLRGRGWGQEGPRSPRAGQAAAEGRSCGGTGGGCGSWWLARPFAATAPCRE